MTNEILKTYRVVAHDPPVCVDVVLRGTAEAVEKFHSEHLSAFLNVGFPAAVVDPGTARLGYVVGVVSNPPWQARTVAPSPTNPRGNLVDELDAAFTEAAAWVDASVECDEADDGETILHEEGCGCNAVVSIAKYDAASARFHAALALLKGGDAPR